MESTEGLCAKQTSEFRTRINAAITFTEPPLQEDGTGSDACPDVDQNFLAEEQHFTIFRKRPELVVHNFFDTVADLADAGAVLHHFVCINTRLFFDGFDL